MEYDIEWYTEKIVMRYHELTDRVRYLQDSNNELRSILAHLTKHGESTWASPVNDKYKIATIKQVRNVTGYGLKEAKEFVEGTRPLYLLASQRDLIDNLEFTVDWSDTGC